MNYKGQELTQADLVRNYILMRLPKDRQEKVYNELWLPLQSKFKDKIEQSKHATELTNLFWYYLRKDGQDVNSKEIYQAFKGKFEKSNCNVVEELQTLVVFSDYYKFLKFPDEESNKFLKRWFKRFLRLDFTTAHIFILNVYHEYKMQRLTLEDFEKLLRYLESYFIRRFFAGVSTKVLGSVFNKLFQQVKDKNSNNLAEDCIVF